MRTTLPEKASVMPIAENLTLDAATSKALGFKSATVPRGEREMLKEQVGIVVLKDSWRDQSVHQVSRIASTVLA